MSNIAERLLLLAQALRLLQMTYSVSAFLTEKSSFVMQQYMLQQLARFMIIFRTSLGFK